MIFHKQNFLYDNGIINFLLILREIYGDEKGFDYEMDGDSYLFTLRNDEYDIQMRLTHTSLEVEKGSEEEIETLFIDVFSSKNQCIYESKKQTQWYWDKQQERFVKYNSMYAEGFAGGDVINASQLWIPLDEILYKGEPITEDVIRNEILNIGSDDLVFKKMCKNRKLYMEDNKVMKSKEGKQCLKTYGTIEQFNKIFTGYLLSDSLDSRTHPFETGGTSFKDLFENNKPIGIANNIIYQLGYSLQKYFIYDYNYYFYSDSLFDLRDIKLQLGIKDQKIEVRDDKKKQQKVLQQNINFAEMSYDFRCNSESDYELKILYYVYSTFRSLSNIDDKLNSFLERNPSIYSYTDGLMKGSLNYYQKIGRLFRLFEELEQKTIEVGKEKRQYSLLYILFGPYGVLQTIYNIKTKKIPPLLLNKTTQHILSFISLRSLYMDAQNHFIQQKDVYETLPEGIEEIENLYLEEIGQKKLQPLHELCYLVGHGIGTYLAGWDDKSYIFKLRNVKTRSGLVGWIQEFHHLMLKNMNKQDEKKPERIGSKTKDSLSKLLEQIEKTNREVIKDYIGIYMIQQYQLVRKAIAYSKKKQQD